MSSAHSKIKLYSSKEVINKGKGRGTLRGKKFNWPGQSMRTRLMVLLVQRTIKPGRFLAARAPTSGPVTASLNPFKQLDLRLLATLTR